MAILLQRNSDDTATVVRLVSRPHINTEDGEAAPNPDPVSARNVIIALILFALTLAVYGATMCRTIYTGDDGDFITAMATGGTPHPTGYPLFCLLGRVFLLLPLGEPAFRINLMTAICGASAVAFCFRLLARLLRPGQWILAATGALIWGFAPTLWQQSLSCEVYSLTCAFLALILYQTVGFFQNPQDTRNLRWLAFTYGLGVTNHLALAVFLPVFALAVFLRRKTLIREGAALLSVIGLFVLPLTLYGYLYIAGSGDSPVNWGRPNNAVAIWEHITGAQYRDAMGAPFAVWLARLPVYRDTFAREFGYYLLWLVPVGAFALLRGSRAAKPGASDHSGVPATSDNRNAAGPWLVGLLIPLWLLNLVTILNYNIFDIYVYYLPAYLFATVFMTVGAAFLLDKLVAVLRFAPDQTERYARLLAPVALMIPVVTMSFHYAETDKSRNFLEIDYAENILRSSPQGTLIASGGATTFTLWYEKFVLGKRADVTAMNYEMARGMLAQNGWYYWHIRRQYPEIRFTNGPKAPVPTPFDVASGEFMMRMLRRAVRRGTPTLLLPDERDIGHPTTTKANSPTVDTMMTRDFDRVPWGVCERLYLKGTAPSADVIVRENARIWKSYQTRGLYTGWAHNDPMQSHIARRYALMQVTYGKWAERAHRFDLADKAYADAQRLYKIPEADQGRARCEARLQANAG